MTTAPATTPAVADKEPVKAAKPVAAAKPKAHFTGHHAAQSDQSSKQQGDYRQEAVGRTQGKPRQGCESQEAQASAGQLHHSQRRIRGHRCFERARSASFPPRQKKRTASRWTEAAGRSFRHSAVYRTGVCAIHQDRSPYQRARGHSASQAWQGPRQSQGAIQSALEVTRAGLGQLKSWPGTPVLFTH